MPDIVAFLEARLAEDAKRWQTIWRFKAGDKSVDGWWDLGGTFGYAVNDIIDTTRGGREVASKRAILELHGGARVSACCCAREMEGYTVIEWYDSRTDPCPTLRLLAAPYAEHPDYDPAWRIDG